MRSLSATVRRLTAQRNFSPDHAAPADADRLSDLENFGSNPGALHARTYVPAGLAKSAPLVVVLHGCTQTAAGYDHGSGWSTLADRYGFALLFPEQQRANNGNLCFNWYVPHDIKRDAGEPLSIRQMIAAMVARHGLDEHKVFVTGLSAGGAMTSVMLATYPEVFAGGTIIAGLPHGIANTLPEALERMRGHGGRGEHELGALVRAASPHKGPWPKVSVWHGTADHIVSDANAEAIIAQWRSLHGLSAQPTRTEIAAGHPHRIWSDANGRDCIEEYRITGMGHGVPINPRGPDGVGVAQAHMLDVGLSAAETMVRTWGIGQARATQPHATASRPRVLVGTVEHGADTGYRPAPQPAAPGAGPAASGVGKIIEDALRSAGLMR